MTTFLVRSFDEASGYSEKICPSGALPRTREESYVPWALTSDKRVVYAQAGQSGSWRGGGGLRPYDSAVSQERRRLCQSELGVMALNQPGYTREAVRKVSSGVRFYVRQKFWSDQSKTVNAVYKNIGHYFFTGGRKGFGRISVEDSKKMDPKDVYDRIMYTLDHGRVDQIMAIHDAIGRKVLGVLGGDPLTKYKSLGPTVRQDWFDNPLTRGRANAPQRATATTLGGIASSSNPVGGVVAQERTRGVDSFQRDTGRTRDADGDQFYDDVDARNLLFGAGISGTTGTLLQAGIAFGKLQGGDELKQYTLAIVGYLIGGGMHSYHETMAVAAKAGVPYNPGAYVTSLPGSFTATHAYKAWAARYYDIVVLGALHWRHNSTCLPSHLNKELADAV